MKSTVCPQCGPKKATTVRFSPAPVEEESPFQLVREALAELRRLGIKRPAYNLRSPYDRCSGHAELHGPEPQT